VLNHPGPKFGKFNGKLGLQTGWWRAIGFRGQGSLYGAGIQVSNFIG